MLWLDFQNSDPNMSVTLRASMRALGKMIYTLKYPDGLYDLYLTLLL